MRKNWSDLKKIPGYQRPLKGIYLTVTQWEMLSALCEHYGEDRQKTIRRLIEEEYEYGLGYEKSLASGEDF